MEMVGTVVYLILIAMAVLMIAVGILTIVAPNLLDKISEVMNQMVVNTDKHVMKVRLATGVLLIVIGALMLLLISRPF